MNLKQILELAKENNDTTLGQALKYADLEYTDDDYNLQKIYDKAARIGTYFCSIDSCLEKLNQR